VNIPDNFDFLFRQTEAKYRFDESGILSLFEEASADTGVKIDECENIGSYSGKIGRYFYRWEIESTENSQTYTVEESILISRRWLYLILLPPLLISLLLIDFILTSTTSTLFLRLSAIVTLSIYTLSFASFLEAPSLLDKTQNRSEQYETGTSISRFNLLVVLVLFAGSIGVVNGNKAVGSIAVLATFGLVMMAFTRVQNSGTPLKLRKGIPLVFPPLLTVYLMAAGLLFIAQISVFSLYLTQLLGYKSPISIAIGYFLLLFAWYIIRIALTGDGAVEAYLRSIEEQPENEQPKIRILNLIVGVLPSIILIYGYIAVVYILQLNLTELEDAVLILTGFIPGLYILTGTTIQTISFVAMMRSQLGNSSPMSTELKSEYSLRKLKSDAYDAYAISTFTNHYIIISERLLEEFEDDEVQSIIYHEESHIENGDSFLSFIIPIIGLITFAPQGVLFESLDFRSREIRADREAFSRSDGKLEDTLTKLRTKQVFESEDEGESTFSPFSGELNEDENKPDEYRLLYGAHALEEAHLSIPERIERLRNHPK
jgi:Zn-dependent protease with chaperone function